MHARTLIAFCFFWFGECTRNFTDVLWLSSFEKVVFGGKLSKLLDRIAIKLDSYFNFKSKIIVFFFFVKYEPCSFMHNKPIDWLYFFREYLGEFYIVIFALVPNLGKTDCLISDSNIIFTTYIITIKLFLYRYYD